MKNLDSALFDLEGTIRDLEHENNKLSKQLTSIKNQLRKIEEDRLAIEYSGTNWEIKDESVVVASDCRLLGAIDRL